MDDSGRTPRRVALVTGVSRQQGIAWTLARRLLADGHDVMTTGWAAHDAEMPWGADELDAEALAATPTAGAGGPRTAHSPLDLADPAAPARLVAETLTRFGRLDVVVVAHARSTSFDLAATTADDLDAAWAVNARATVLLAQAFGASVRDGRAGPSLPLGTTHVPGTLDRRLVLFTSGQHLGPLPGEIAYAVSKGAVQQMTATLAHELADLGMTVNCVNPGPVDTGWATGEVHTAVAGRFPAGRWGTPQDVSGLVAWLTGPDGGWMTGQTLDLEGGFRR